MKCPNCGQIMADDSKFCSNCGTPFYRTYESYNASKVNMFFLSHNDKFPEDQITAIREQLLYIDENKWSEAYSISYKDPLIALLLSLFVGQLGIDRFYVGDTGLGICKLLTCGGLGIWTIIDWFLIMGTTREKNFMRLMSFI